MKKLIALCISAIVLLACLSNIASYAAANSASVEEGNEDSSDLFRKDSGMRLGDLPAKAREKISRHLQKAEYEVSRCEKSLPSGKTISYRAFNRNQNMIVSFAEQGISLLENGNKEPAWHLEMTLSSYGFDGAMVPVRPVQSDTIKVSGHRVEYRRGKLTEWYVNDDRGIEQGVTLSEPPGGKKRAP